MGLVIYGEGINEYFHYIVANGDPKEMRIVESRHVQFDLENPMK